jgi:predicted HicB family RNase H-like nuclease
MNVTGNDEALWGPEGTLGNDERFVALAPEAGAAVDATLDLQLISLRLPRQLVVDLQARADKSGLILNALVRKALTEYVESYGLE